MESSSEFIVPANFSSEWRDVMFVKRNSRTEIYTATRYGRRFLLKALSPSAASLTDYRIQQEQEFQLGVQLVHPNIAATYGLEKVEGIGRCIVQEWIDGQTLREWQQSNPSKSARERIFLQLLEALEYLHSLQLVHHDLKADNILITRNGTNVKLIDFGLSATDATLSPVPNDPRTDIAALQRLFPDICPKGQFATIASLRKVIERRKRVVRLLPVVISALLLAAAVTLFYISWNEHRIEQQRFEAMTSQIDAQFAQERTYLLSLINKYEYFDSNKKSDMQAYTACYEGYSAYVQSQWVIRDSLMNLYEDTDPQREQFWQMWTRREAEMNNELIPLLAGKLKTE